MDVMQHQAIQHGLTDSASYFSVSFQRNEQSSQRIYLRLIGITGPLCITVGTECQVRCRFGLYTIVLLVNFLNFSSSMMRSWVSRRTVCFELIGNLRRTMALHAKKTLPCKCGLWINDPVVRIVEVFNIPTGMLFSPLDVWTAQTLLLVPQTQNSLNQFWLRQSYCSRCWDSELSQLSLVAVKQLPYFGMVSIV